MRRSALSALALILLPALLAGQTPPADGFHRVVPGETLGGIAQRYFGSAGEWRRIFEANRDRIPNPDRIQVGMELRIPGVLAARTQAEVLGLQLDGAPVFPDDSFSFEARRELLRSTLFVPGSAEEIDLQNRTVFYEARPAERGVPLVIVQRLDEIPAVPPGVFESAGWLIPEGDRRDFLGEVEGFAADLDIRFGRGTARPHDEIRIHFLAEGTPLVGEEFLTYELLRSLPGLGEVAAPTGRVRVIEVDQGGVVATVVAGFGRIRRGDLVTLPRSFPLVAGIHPSPSAEPVGARLLAFQDPKELHLPGDFAFIDQGRSAGLQVGDELVGRSGGGDGWAGREVVRFQVVGVQDGTSTVRILTVESPAAVRPGLDLTLDRRMP